jgi:hypothetical protein
MGIKSVTAFITAAGLLASVATALAADPTQADFDTCNKEAQSRLSNPAASPSTSGGPTGSMSGSTAKDHPAAASPSTDADTALRGIDASGKSDPSFQTAYRDCMKRRGF